MADVTPLPAIWEVPDALWARIEALLNEFDPPKLTGCKRKDPRALLNGIIYRFRTGYQWERIPKVYGDDSTIHRALQGSSQLQLFELLWRWLVEEGAELALVEWEWQAADGWLGKARSGGDAVGPNPTDRAKNGTKKSLLTDAGGGPLSIVIAPANVNDHKLLEATIAALVVERPKLTPQRKQHLCLDKAYDKGPSRKVVKRHGYQNHTRRIGEEKLELQGEKKTSGPALRRRKNDCLVSPVQRLAGALRTEERKLPGATAVRLCLALVSAPA